MRWYGQVRLCGHCVCVCVMVGTGEVVCTLSVCNGQVRCAHCV